MNLFCYDTSLSFISVGVDGEGKRVGGVFISKASACFVVFDAGENGFEQAILVLWIAGEIVQTEHITYEGKVGADDLFIGGGGIVLHRFKRLLGGGNLFIFFRASGDKRS